MKSGVISEKEASVVRQSDRLQRSSTMRKEIQDFISEMEAGLCGTSSLPMIPTYLGIAETNPYSSPILVVDAGGTNLRVARVRFGENGFEVLGVVKGKMPGTGGTITADALFEQLVDAAEPLLEGIELCGFCFSYPAEIQKNRDGKIIAFSKDVEVTGSEGLLIGESMNAELVRRGRKPLQFCVLNDTVATYFGGCSRLAPEAYDSAIGMILGTGINSAYLEKAEKIGKIAPAPYDMAINIESGKFNKVEMQPFDRMLDENSAMPGDAWMEKKISGAYLGNNLYYALLDACEKCDGIKDKADRDAAEGLPDNAFRARLLEKGGIETAELSLFTEDPYGESAIASLCRTAEERDYALKIADQIVDRAAYLVVCHLAAIMEHCDTGTHRTEPATIIVEGSTWQKFQALRERIIYYAHQIITLEQGRYYRVCAVEGSNLIGSAWAAAASRRDPAAS